MQHIGVDVSKDYLDIHFHQDKEARRYRNTPQAIGKLIKSLRGKEVAVTMEATGGYERLLLTGLHAAKVPSAVVNARHIRHFARATGCLAKTDRLDAAMISRYAATVGVRMQEILPDYALKDLTARRRQLIDLLVQEKNRLEKAQDTFLKAQIKDHLAFLKQQLRTVDESIAGHIRNTENQQRAFAILTSVPGVGDITAAVLLADMPELGCVNEREIAALAGLAPLNNDSGHSRGQRRIFGGRASVRCTLYMAAVASVRHNAHLKAFYQRLRSSGKPSKLALTAVMRKLLIILNALVKDNRHWKNVLDG